MISVMKANGPGDYFRRSAAKSFLKVLLVGDNSSDLESLVRQLSGGAFRLGFRPFWLIARPNGPGLIIKTFTCQSVLEGLNPAFNLSTFDAVWVYEHSSEKLAAVYRRIAPKLPAELPRVGVTSENGSGRYGEQSGEDDLRLIVRLPNLTEVGEEALNSIVDRTLLGMRDLRKSTPRGPHWKSRGRTAFLTGLFGLGLITVVALGIIFYRKKAK